PMHSIYGKPRNYKFDLWLPLCETSLTGRKIACWGDPMTQNRIYFFDTTLRDGEQSPGCSMTHHEKLALAGSLADLGVDILEAGFAIASDGDFAAITAIAQQVRWPEIASLARARQEDIERAAKSVEKAARPRIHVFLASSDIHLEYKLKISRTEAL